MKRKKTATIFVTLLLLASAGIYFYYGFLFKEARNIESEKPTVSTSATNLMNEYNSNQEKSDSLYLNKTIEVTGKVTKETDSVVVLDSIVFCLFIKKKRNKLLNSRLSVKGKCIGYDELFQEVKLDQCIINKQSN
ncbi:hypothetical protein FVB9288_01546 [Flavobacterium sp. CECT 9288]|uniref:OB-fold putative lipoprotein n=1 Tax=Flavobacterium sp. CECT 9288 TaxID=2845819 RepID=UPI001E464ADA|nr:OB-fold putative lipoprotein [Flavobacterium sp. CECT 9288]CAH0335883.1 hypothetical protein FVB9288_01546 [Flavobacterium sp. CECT 9288]